MANSPDIIADVPVLSDEKRRKRTQVGVGIGLGVTSALAVAGQHLGWFQETTPPVEAAFNSMAHPAVGYLGALATVWAADHLRQKPPMGAASVIGGTVANFSVEAAQDRVFSMMGVVGSDESAIHFWERSQTAETTKDYLFALGGVAAYLLTEKWHKRRTKKENTVQ